MNHKIAVLLLVVFGVVVTTLYLALAFVQLAPQKAIVHSGEGLPVNYTMEEFTVEKELGTPCRTDNDCITPGEYMMISRCPMRAICIESKCAVICPGYKEIK